jgi:hypothetical protein
MLKAKPCVPMTIRFPVPVYDSLSDASEAQDRSINLIVLSLIEDGLKRRRRQARKEETATVQ